MLCLFVGQSLPKILQFHLISCCGNFMERHSFCIVSGNSPESMWKLCFSTKFSRQEISEMTVFFAGDNITTETLFPYTRFSFRNIWAPAWGFLDKKYFSVNPFNVSIALCCANQLTSFYMRVTLTFNGLIVKGFTDAFTYDFLMKFFVYKQAKWYCYCWNSSRRYRNQTWRFL